MTSNQKKTLEEYAQLKAERSALDDQLDELKPQVEEIMKENDGQPIEAEYGKFTLVERTKWNFPPHVQTLEDQLFDVKEHCKATGDVEEETFSYVKFSATN